MSYRKFDYLDSSVKIIDDTDDTKMMQLDVSGITPDEIRVWTVPDSNSTFVGNNLNQTLTNKSIDGDLNTITNIDNADIKSGAAIDATKIHDGTVNNTEFGYLDGVTSAIQTQLDDKSAVGHTHAASDTVSGTFANARISESSVTQHEGAITHQNLSGAGTNTHAQIDTHIADATKHRIINDSGTSATELWSASKVNTELGGKSSTGHTHTASDVTDFSSAADARITLQKGAANGLATLDSGGKVPASQLNLDNVESNSGSNVGTGGVGIYKDKSGSVLRFKKINTGSSKVTVTDDTGNDEIDIDVDETTINHNNLLNYNVAQHRIINDSGTSATELWSASKINTQLAGKAATSHTHAAADVISGTFPDARISQSSVTQHETAIDHNNLLNYNVAQHRIINDSGTSTTELWSASKINTQLAGKVSGPNSATNNTVPRYDSTTGKLIKTSGVVIDDTNNLTIGNASTGTVFANKELVLHQDGDTYGSSILRLRNRTGENGAIFETTDPSITLVDFIFKTNSNQRNIRYESRATAQYLTAPEFQIGIAADPTLIVDDSKILVRGSIDVTGTVDGRDIATDGSTQDTHIADATKHRIINDSGTSATELWSASKINTELSGKAATSHNHSASDITSGTLGVVRGGTGAATLASGKILQGAGTGAITATLTAPSGELVGTTDAQTLTNKTLTATTNNIAAKSLHSATTVVNVASATAPSAGQVLMATSSTAATWQTPSSGVTDHTLLTNIGTNTHAQIDTHIADATKHRIINDSGTSATELWSASKINSELSGKASTSHTHAASDVISGTFSDARISETSVTQHATALESAMNHDDLTGFVGNEHIDHTAVSITAGVGLTGGGTIAATRTIDLDISGLTEDTSPDILADYIVTYDASATTHKKVLLDNLPSALSMYDAIVAPTDAEGDYTSVAAAFTAGHQTVFVLDGTYTETSDVLVPSGGCLVGESMNGAIINFASAAYSIKSDGNGGLKETAGTISITSGSSTVTGVGTAFTNINPVGSDTFIVIEHNAYPVASITSNTTLTIGPTFKGRTINASSNFAVMHMNSTLMISNLTVVSSTSAGIYLRGIRHAMFSNVVMRNNVGGIQLIDCVNCNLLGFLSQNNSGIGVSMTDCYSCTLKDNQAFNSGGHGYNVAGMSNNIIIDSCQGSNGGGHGLNITGTANNIQVKASIFNNNASGGINTDP